jgi:cytochrome P450
MRKLLSHAFSDTALRQQEDLMSLYFELLVQRLNEKIDSPASGKVDLTQWYNFLTFDIIGDLCFGESFGALESGEYHVWMKNLFQGIKYARFLSIATFYEPAMTILKAIVKLSPSIQKARDEHEKFTYHKTAQRLDTKTDRKDFMSYVSVPDLFID